VLAIWLNESGLNQAGGYGVRLGGVSLLRVWFGFIRRFSRLRMRSCFGKWFVMKRLMLRLT